jgi:hypothetical protein
MKKITLVLLCTITAFNVQCGRTGKIRTSRASREDKTNLAQLKVQYLDPKNNDKIDLTSLSPTSRHKFIAFLKLLDGQDKKVKRIHRRQNKK